MFYLYAFVTKKAYFIFFQNTEDLQNFSELYGLKESKTKLLPGSGVDTSLYSFHSLPNKQVLTIGMFCRLIEPKGVRNVYKAVKFLNSINEVKLNFVLGGLLSQDKKIAIPLSDIMQWHDEGVVKFLGSLSSSQVRESMLECHCIVLPSVYSEGTPRTLIEAASLGRIIITSDHPGCRRLYNKKNGYLLKPNSQEDLVNALKELSMMSQENRSKMGMESRKLAISGFDERHVLNAYKQVIKECDAH